MTKLFLALVIATSLMAGFAFADKPNVEAIIAVDKDTQPATTFEADVPKLYAFFRSKGTKKGDKLRAVWIADDVGEAAPKNTKIDEAPLDASQDDFYGAFSLSKPTKGWPAGQYHVEIYVGETLATTAKFTIKAGESKEDDSKEDSSDEGEDEDSKEE